MRFITAPMRARFTHSRARRSLVSIVTGKRQSMVSVMRPALKRAMPPVKVSLPVGSSEQAMPAPSP